MSTQLKNEHARLMAEIQIKQENFVRKERAYSAKIEALEANVVSIRNSRRAWMDKDKNIVELKKMHSEVQEKVELVQMRTAKLVQDQEQELLRAFKQRLSDVQGELETEKMGSTKEGGIVGWMEKSRSFECKAAKERERADREDRIFTTRTREANTLNVHLKLQTDDRAQLIKQLVAVKKHNTALRSSLEEYTKEQQSLENHFKDHPFPIISMGAAHGPQFPEIGVLPREAAETRYGEVLKSLTRMLASERKAEASTLTALEEHNASISHLEITLRQCVDEVTKQTQVEMLKEENLNIESFQVEERERALEIWLTTEGVLDHLMSTEETGEPHRLFTADLQTPVRTPDDELHSNIRSPSPRVLPPLL